MYRVFKRGCILWVVAGLMGVLATSAQAATYSGGSGTETDPYQIGSEADWTTLTNTSSDWNKRFILISDIDFSDAILTPVAPDTDDQKQGFQGTSFTGVFDGNGHMLRNGQISMPASDYVGLFGSVGYSGVIRNLGVENLDVTGNDYVGSLLGVNNGMATSCYTLGTVTGGNEVGGLVGRNNGTIMSCYSTGKITGGNYNRYVGGLVGNNERLGNVTSCYAIGAVTGGYDIYVGGLVGDSSGCVTSCYWDIESTGQTKSGGGRGLTTTQMKTISYYSNANWNSYSWVMREDAYPRLNWERLGWPAIPAPEAVPLTGSGTEADPYLITSAAEFALLSWHTSISNKHIRLTKDLDLDGFCIYPIGDLGPFSGVFNGADHLLRNSMINLPQRAYVGLFGYVGTGGMICNLGVENVAATGNYYVGALVGLNRGTVTSCYVTGEVTGGGTSKKHIGGLVGYNGGTITSCHAAGSVTGYYSVGGLVGGSNGGWVTSCYATGMVAGFEYVGGLVGSNGSQVTSCYAKSTITGLGRTDIYISIGGLVGSNGSLITSCYATGTIMCGGSYNFVGGLVGENYWGASITSCYATGAIEAPFSVGGLAGYNNGRITSCHAAGSVTGKSSVGGLVGQNARSVTSCNASGAVTSDESTGGLIGLNRGSVMSCYATGPVTAGKDCSAVGGLVGENDLSTITSCYATGKVTTGEYCSYVGGLVGRLMGNRSDSVMLSYWDIESTGQATSAGGEGRTTTEMTYPYAANTYVVWDFTEVWTADVDYSVNNGYPYLRDYVPPEEGEPLPEGEGEVTEGEGETPVEGEGEGTLYTLTITSEPIEGVPIQVSPPDTSSQTGGNTVFTRTYPEGTSITLKAPTYYNSYVFQQWLFDNSFSSFTPEITLDVRKTYTLTAVFSKRAVVGSHLEIWDEEIGAFKPLAMSLTPGQSIVVLVHGWNRDNHESLNHDDEYPWQEMASAFHNCENHPVVLAWNWLDEARSVPAWWSKTEVCLQPTSKVKGQGNLLADALLDSTVNANTAYNIHFVGHSLGAGVSTWATLGLRAEGCNNNIRLALLDAPENAAAFASYICSLDAGPVNLDLLVGCLVEYGAYPVSVENYITEFGKTYDTGTNFYLKDAANDAHGLVENPGEDWPADHALSNAWYKCTIEPNSAMMPGSDEGESLENDLKAYFAHLSTPSLFWKGVKEAGYGFSTFRRLRPFC